MSRISSAYHEELLGLLSPYCDGSITDADGRRLEALLRNDDDARRVYVEYLHLHQALRSTSRAPVAGVAGPLPSGTPAFLPEEVPTAESPTWLRVMRMLPGGEFTVGLLVVLAVVAAFATLQSYRRCVAARNAANIAGATGTPDSRTRSAPDGADVSLYHPDPPLAVLHVPADATVVDQPAAVSGQTARPIAAGNRVHVRNGLAELRFRNGVALSVAGPAELEPTNDFNVRLHSGQLVARVPADSRGFTVQTPLAAIVDLGTEFGVRSIENGPTEVAVFKGIVDVIPGDRARQTLAFERTVHLRAGDSLRVDTAGNVSAVQNDKSDAAQQSLQIRPFAGASKYIDLADVVAGGDGRGSASGGIDPRTGEMLSRLRPDDNMETFSYLSDGRYHAVPQNRWIDGIFIPDSQHGSVQLDSVGHPYSDFGKLDGRSYAPIWAGSATPLVYFSTQLDTDYAAGHRLISMHANTGLTVKLGALAAQFDGYEMQQFTARVGNGSYPLGAANSTAGWGVWVFVDGQLRFSRPQVYAGSLGVAVALSSQDQLMTIVTTDGGDGYDGDRVLLGDPQIVLRGRVEKDPAAESPPGSSK